MELVAATEVNTQLHMLLFVSLLANPTLLLLLAASPRNPLLETLSFISPVTALTPKTQRPPPRGSSSSPRTMLPAVPSAGLHQIGYKILAVAATDVNQRRPSCHPRRP